MWQFILIIICATLISDFATKFAEVIESGADRYLQGKRKLKIFVGAFYAWAVILFLIFFMVKMTDELDDYHCKIIVKNFRHFIGGD